MINKNKFFLLLMLSLFFFICTAEETKDIPSQNILPTEKYFTEFVDTLDKALTKLANKRIAVLGFITLDGPVFIKDAILTTERLTQVLVFQNKFEVIDRTLLGVENLSAISLENAQKWQKNFKLGSIITGTVLRKSKDTLEVNWRLIELNNLTILTSNTFLMKPDWNLKGGIIGSSDISKENKLPVLLNQKIEEIKLSNLDEKTKQETILKTIAEFYKPSDNTTYKYTYFSCAVAEKYCKDLRIKEGFYKIYYSDELVLTVDKEGKILESYYYGKNNPVRKDINLEEFLNNKDK